MHILLPTERPETTLFILQSADGKISTGENDTRDVDQDFTRIPGVKEGLHQYYDLEQQNAFVSFSSGKVQAKVGINSRNSDTVKKEQVSFIIVDNKPHLDLNGCEYLAKRSFVFYIITTNKNHPVFSLEKKYSNIGVFYYEKEIDFLEVFKRLKQDLHIPTLTIQSGGTLNALLLRLGLIDHVSLILAPCLIGGDKTQSTIGGESLQTDADLRHIKPLKLIKSTVLNDSYLHLQYDVLNETH